MPQLARTAIRKGDFLYFRCPYQAMVMKMLETVSRRMVCMDLPLEKICNGIPFFKRGGESPTLPGKSAILSTCAKPIQSSGEKQTDFGLNELCAMERSGPCVTA